MKSRFVTPKYDSVITAVVLHANDIVATVFILDIDENGSAITTVASVDLPFKSRNYRQTEPEGKSMFQRGDLIKIRCSVSQEDEKLSDAEIEELIETLDDFEEDNAELFADINERAKRFTKDWQDLCKKDLAKRSQKFDVA